jgi:hypothetical protein
MGDRPRSREPHSVSATDSAIAVAEIVHLYVECGLSTYRIANEVRIDRQRVARILRREGVAIVPRGAGRRRPLKVVDVLSEETLRDLYVGTRLSSTNIGRMLGLSDRFVRSRLALWGIERRTRGQWDRHDRTDVEPDELGPLYRDKELAAAAAGEELGVSGQIALRSAHTHGLAVRAGGAPRPSEVFDIHLIEALYDDSEVARVLSAHQIPIIRDPGPIWQRFPTPVPLTKELLTALYVECGLSSFHIELLTGQPTQTVLRRLDRSHIARRGRGGRSPFMQRWHKRRRLQA